MGNAENIKKHRFTSEQSREEAAKNGRKGGKASGKARAAKAVFRELLAKDPAAILTKEQLEQLREQGINTDGKTALEAAAAQALFQWLSGDQSAGKLILSVSGMDEAAEKRKLDAERLKLERERLEWLKSGKPEGISADTIAAASEQILMMDFMLRNPLPSRNIEDFAVSLPDEESSFSPSREEVDSMFEFGEDGKIRKRT